MGLLYPLVFKMSVCSDYHNQHCHGNGCVYIIYKNMPDFNVGNQTIFRDSVTKKPMTKVHVQKRWKASVLAECPRLGLREEKFCLQHIDQFLQEALAALQKGNLGYCLPPLHLASLLQPMAQAGRQGQGCEHSPAGKQNCLVPLCPPAGLHLGLL